MSEKAKCPDCKRNIYQSIKHMGKYYCSWCAKHYDKPSS